MNAIRYYYSVAACKIKMHIQSQMEYPSFLFGWMLSNPLQFGLGILGIFIIVSNFGAIGDWDFHEITFLYGMSVVSHGLSVVFFVQTWSIEYMVREGEFDQFFLRPMGIFFQFSIDYFNLIGITDMLPGLVILIYGCFGIHFDPTFLNITKLVVTILGAILIRGGIFLAMGSIAFFTKSSNALVDVNLRMFDSVSMYPLSIYPNVIQMLFTYLFPIGFITFYSAREFLGKADGLPMFSNAYLITLLVGIVVFILAFLFFKKGLNRYESSGS